MYTLQKETFRKKLFERVYITKRNFQKFNFGNLISESFCVYTTERNFRKETFWTRIHLKRKFRKFNFWKFIFVMYTLQKETFRKFISKSFCSVSSKLSEIKFRKENFWSRTGSTSKSFFPKVFLKTNQNTRKIYE